MKTRIVLLSVVMLAALAMITAQAPAQDKQQTPSMEEMMAEYAKYAAPGPQHKALEPLIGNWKAITKWWMDPAAPAETSSATSTAKWILGGRFVQEDVVGMMEGTPFHGMGITGYDNFKKEYIAFWIDEMATSFMFMNGQADASGKIITMQSEYEDPASGKTELYKTVTIIDSNDKHTYQMFKVGEDGKEIKNFEVVYTRQK